MARALTPDQRRKRAYAALKRLARKPRITVSPRPYYAARRVPQTFRPSYLRKHLLRLTPLGLAAVGATVASAMPVGDHRRQLAWELSEKFSAELSDRAQKLYFDNPGLDTLTVRALGTHARRLTRAGRLYLQARVALGWDKDGRATSMIPLVPTVGYDALMVTMLVVGTGLGYFTGGRAHATLAYDSANPEPSRPLPAGHRRPQPRRLHAPRTLTDTAADIDDLYWAHGYGQSIKITAVGALDARRWVVSVPGTDNMSPTSTTNPADFEANIREALNLPSAMRVGVIRALHQAMREVGVSDHSAEPILMVGHSQGGMIATALASLPVGEYGLNVTGVLTMGSPSRRMRIRDGVTMLAIAHDQDVIPSVDGSADRSIDQRVDARRRLNRPRSGALYYAHSSTTYTETLREIERRIVINPFGRVAETVNHLREYLPREGEETRVFICDIWQDLLKPSDEHTWDTVDQLADWAWEPVPHANDWAPAPLISGGTLPAHIRNTAFELQKYIVNMRKWWTNDDSTTTTE